MRAIDAFADLRRFGAPVLTTEEAAIRLRATRSATSRILARLAEAKLVLPLCRGLWSLDPAIDPLLLPEYLTVPHPAYVSFQSALYLHGMVSQIPQVIYVASLGQTRQVATAIGTYSIHRIAPEFFGGYEWAGKAGVKLATPVKALLDTLYLTKARSRLFATLPEIELPRRFSRRQAERWIKRIQAPYLQTMVRRRLEQVLAEARPQSAGPSTHNARGDA